MSSSPKPASSEEEGLLALACHCRVTPLTGKQWWATKRHPMVPGQWHERLTEALRDGARENRQGACCWLGLLRQGGWQRNTPPSKSYQHQEQEEMDSTIPGKKGPSGGRQGLPDVTPLETKKRGIWAEERGVRTGRI